MPNRLIIAKELADIFKILAHRDRIRIIEALRVREYGVNPLAKALDLPPTRVSQHLALMRAHRFVEERREGRNVIYHLTQPDLAHWIVDGLQFVEARAAAEKMNSKTVNQVREMWINGDANPLISSQGEEQP